MESGPISGRFPPLRPLGGIFLDPGRFLWYARLVPGKWF